MQCKNLRFLRNNAQHLHHFTKVANVSETKQQVLRLLNFFSCTCRQRLIVLIRSQSIRKVSLHQLLAY